MKANPIILASCLFTVFTSCKPAEESSTQEQAPAAAEAIESTTPEGVATQLAKLQTDLAVVMETVTDKASAEAAIPKVELIAAGFAKIGKQMEEVKEDPGPELKAKLEAIIQPAQERVQAAMTKAMPIIAQDPALGEKFQNAMSKMNAE